LSIDVCGYDDGGGCRGHDGYDWGSRCRGYNGYNDSECCRTMGMGRTWFLTWFALTLAEEMARLDRFVPAEGPVGGPIIRLSEL
jgi:hypothetical protein